MKWYNDSRYSALIQKASNDIYNYATTKFPEVRMLQSDAAQILNAYLDFSSNIGQPFTTLNRAENQKPFQDNFIKGMYIIIKNFPDENAFKNSRFDLALRDKIWVGLEPIKKILSTNYPILYTPFNIPSDYQVVQQAQQIQQPTPIIPSPSPIPQPIYQVAQQPYQVAPPTYQPSPSPATIPAQPFYPEFTSGIQGDLKPLIALCIGGIVIYQLFKKK